VAGEVHRLREACRGAHSQGWPHGRLGDRTPEEFAKFSAHAKGQEENGARLSGTEKTGSTSSQMDQFTFSIYIYPNHLDNTKISIEYFDTFERQSKS
jgi:hypothetical protein